MKTRVTGFPQFPPYSANPGVIVGQPGHIAFKRRARFAPARHLAAAIALLLACAPAVAQEKPKNKPVSGFNKAAEAEFYKIVPIPIPEPITLECGAIEVMPDGKVAVATRRGDIFMIENAGADPADAAKFTRWATGLHEVLGLAYNPKDKCLYAVQRPEVTRLKDSDDDGRADVYETFCDGWGITGDYHEYPIGSKFDADGNLFVTLCLTGSFSSNIEYRGWCVRVSPDGKLHPYASGIRSPAGMGFNADGDLFYCDNQGPWNGTSSMKHLTKGAFVGHPGGNKWYDLSEVKSELGARPRDPQTKSRFHVEAAKIPEYIPPTILLPHGKVGQSASGIFCDLSGGKFGPFQKHLFAADQHHSNITRIVLEKVNGRYQGVAIPFREGFGSGIVPTVQAPDGSVYVGGTNRGWGSVGPKPFALERLAWTGKTPFEIFDMKVRPDGFDLTFTEPLDKAVAADPKSYDLTTYTYIYQSDYGSPEVDPTTPTVKAATVAADGKSVRLVIEGLQIGHVHELRVPQLKSADGKPLLHPVAYYTLWALPQADGK